MEITSSGSNAYAGLADRAKPASSDRAGEARQQAVDSANERKEAERAAKTRDERTRVDEQDSKSRADAEATDRRADDRTDARESRLDIRV